MIRRRRLWRSPTSYSQEALAVIGAFTTPPTFARAQQIAFMVQSLKACGAWSLIDVLYVMAAADNQAALINWKDPGTLSATVAGTPTFTADQGYTGNGTDGEILTGYDPSSVSLGMAQDDLHGAVFLRTVSTSSGRDLGSGTLVLRGRTGTELYRAGDATDTTGSLTETAPFHLMTVRRDASNKYAFINGAEAATAAVASTAIPSAITFLASGGAAFSNRQCMIGHVGRGLTDAQALGAYGAQRRYLQSIGAI